MLAVAHAQAKTPSLHLGIKHVNDSVVQARTLARRKQREHKKIDSNGRIAKQYRKKAKLLKRAENRLDKLANRT